LEIDNYNINIYILLLIVHYHASGEVLEVMSKTLVQPCVIPPLAGYQVAEPLMRELMLHNF